MEFEQAEKRFRDLQQQQASGVLDAEAFRVEVAKLLLRDGRDGFWMLDADNGEWYRNRGDGWAAGDPHTDPLTEAARPDAPGAKGGRASRLLVLGVALVALFCVTGGLALWQVASDRLATLPLTPSEDSVVQVTIASPPGGSEVPLGQPVAVESMIEARPDLRMVEHVELRVNDQTVDNQPVQPGTPSDPTTLPLLLAWRPTEVGEYLVSVTALSSLGSPLGEATITLHVTETSGEVLPEPDCVPGVTFVADGTIPPDTVFPPGARMDKVWRVRNSGTCAWGAGYDLVLVNGPDLGARTTVPVPPTAAGEATDLGIVFRAPSGTGEYSNSWQLQSPDGEFFGPTLRLTVRVGVLLEEDLVPLAPANLRATVTEDGEAVQLTWEDRSDNEDGFRIHRTDVEASIGLAPADTGLFVDEEVTCGNSYQYTVVAFNAMGASPAGEPVDVTLPPCVQVNAPPSLILTVVPTTVVASEAFTVTFQAEDDQEMRQVVVWGRETGDPVLDDGRVFSCSGAVCIGSWTVTRTQEVSASWTFMALAFDTLNQGTAPGQTVVLIRPPE
jgi:hypothetical protein